MSTGSSVFAVLTVVTNMHVGQTALRSDICSTSRHLALVLTMWAKTSLSLLLELRFSPRHATTALATCGFRGRHVRIWSWKDKQLQKAWRTLVCSL